MPKTTTAYVLLEHGDDSGFPVTSTRLSRGSGSKQRIGALAVVEEEDREREHEHDRVADDQERRSSRSVTRPVG